MVIWLLFIYLFIYLGMVVFACVYVCVPEHGELLGLELQMAMSWESNLGSRRATRALGASSLVLHVGFYL